LKKIIGKQRTLKYFEEALSRKTFSHLYILEGPKGIGKKTLAAHIAAMVHCRAEGVRPCGVCDSCVKHGAGSHPDLSMVENADADKKSIGVETVRGVMSEIYVKPLLSDNKIYIFPTAEILSTSAQNALLKVLEEPPSYAVIILLVSDASALLPTVKSRGILFPIEPCTREETISFVEENFDSDKAAMIADFSGGILGAAKEMSREEAFFDIRRRFYDVLTDVGKNRANQFKIVSFFEAEKASRQLLFDLFISWLRDALFIKTTGGNTLINYDYNAEIHSFASDMSCNAALAAAAHAVEYSGSIGAGSNLGLWIADFTIKCFDD